MDDKTRILYFYRLQNFDTGSPKALAGFIDALDRSRFEPLFLAHGEGPLASALAARGVKLVPAEAASISYRHPVCSLRQLRRVTARLREIRPSLVHVMSFGWNLDLVLAAWMLRIPVILHVHTPEEAGFRNLNRFAAAKVLFCSEFERRNFRHLERISRKTEVLYNAVDMDRFARAAPVRHAFGLRGGEIAIATIAQISWRKGIDILLETARLLLGQRQDLVFLIAGPDAVGEQKFAAEMRQQAIADPVLCGRVRFLGPRQDIPDLLASADLFFLPTRAEPFGIVVVEAMAAGLPAVVSQVGGISEIVTPPNLGCIVPEVAPAAFGRAIAAVLELPDRGRSMGAAARENVRRRFDSAVVGQRLGDIYREVLAARGK